jgi:hypothetical protein
MKCQFYKVDWIFYLQHAQSSEKSSLQTGLLKQSMGAKEPSRNRIVVPARYAGGIDAWAP